MGASHHFLRALRNPHNSRKIDNFDIYGPFLSNSLFMIARKSVILIYQAIFHQKIPKQCSRLLSASDIKMAIVIEEIKRFGHQ